MKWRKGITLGSKHKEFLWKYSIEEGLTISLTFKNGNYITKFKNNELNEIIDYTIKKQRIQLANNVEKLANGTEKEGLGSFIYNTISRETVDAQASSHIAAILFEIGVFDYNGAKRGMEFWVIDSAWEQRFLEYEKDNS